MINVEVVYAASDKQVVKNLSIVEGTTVGQAILASGILREYPEIDLKKNKVGIYSKVVALEQIVKANDRVEIYRSLIIDPKIARRKRS